MDKVADTIKKVNFEPSFREKMVYEDHQERIRGAELESAREQGLKEGLAEGLEKGLEQGIAEGLEQGRAEGMNKSVIKIAKKAKAMGLSTKEIENLTGLTIDEIENL